MKNNFFRQWGRRLLISLLVVAAASALCLILYEYNNKYTYEGSQAMAGTLFVSEEDWSETPLRFLWNGWLFYPDVLLAPENYGQRDQSRAISLQIGAYGNFAFGAEGRPAHGCGTYVMTLLLPEETHTYAMELPEIFSSYRFYVGDRLVMEMGNPDEGSYRPRIQSSRVTFEASGTVRLLLAVRDESHIYSGMTYPPAFGEPLAVDGVRNARMILSAVVVTIAMVFFALSLWLSFRRYRKQENARIFVLLCLCVALFTSYPIIHNLVAVGIHPWYTIELASGYFFTQLIIMLHNRLCLVSGKLRYISGAVAGAVCLLAFLYSSFSGMLVQPTASLFSRLLGEFKMVAAIYLLATSLFSMLGQKGRSEPIFYADIFYASVFLWDYLRPAYEPVWGGWFQEWGGLVQVVTLGAVLWYDVASGYRQSLTFAEERRQLERQLELQQEHYRQISYYVEEGRQLRHDFRHHLRILMKLSDNREKLVAYIREITDSAVNSRPIQYCHDSAMDALLFYYASAAKEKGIGMDIKVEVPEGLALPEVVFCTILGNLLENAVEACQRQGEGERYIRLHIRWQFEKLYTVVENSFNGELRQRGGQFLSSKREGAGIGTQSVRELAKRLKGTVEFQAEGASFRAVVILPLGLKERRL